MNVFPFLTLKNDTRFLLSSWSVRQCMEKMEYYKYSTIPLLDEDGKYIGTVSEGDLLRFAKNHAEFQIEKLEKASILDVPRYRDYRTLTMESSLSDLVNLSMEQNFIPMVDDRNVFMGIIRRRKILEYCKEELRDSLENAV